MAASIEELAFSESLRAIDQQSETIKSIRGSAGTLLGASSIVIAAMGRFGPLALAEDYFSKVPLLLLIASASCCVAILWPREGLVSRFSATAFFASLGGGDRPRLEESFQALALYMDGHVEQNVVQLRHMMWLFQWASVALLAAVAMWVVLLLAGPAVH